jgi:DNA-binding NarL/FixJ family response regulator
VRLATELQPDVILLDVGLPSLNGIEAAREIRTLAPKAKIIFVSQESSANIMQVALAIGAAGYVAKRNALRLVVAVDEVLDGRHFVSAALSGQVVKMPRLTASSDD